MVSPVTRRRNEGRPFSQNSAFLDEIKRFLVDSSSVFRPTAKILSDSLGLKQFSDLSVLNRGSDDLPNTQDTWFKITKLNAPDCGFYLRRRSIFFRGIDVHCAFGNVYPGTHIKKKSLFKIFL